jgi:serine/threonine protein kinase
MKIEPQRTCRNCGNEFSGAMEFCPVCMLRKGLAGGVESGESSASEDTIEPTVEQAAQRFEHYELVTGEDGKPVELGRGAMGVTYKAFDVDLRCPVALKVISERYLGDESARLRFLREARAAARLRHSNVASVLHLGRTGQNYFYAMEFVEGKTLENLIRRSGKLEIKLALEIVAQVAAGLAAVHEQNLVHRDIKPTNIMVRLKEEGGVTAKIIDLGLAKTLDESASEAGISSPGVFVGTPEFASPEQFAGVSVDIRSDLYSLGVTLWVMDPAQRFQIPNELLTAIPRITGAIDARRRIARQSLLKMPSAASHVGTRKPPARLGPKKISVARLPVTGSDVFGREEDVAFLDRAWANRYANVVTIVGWAGIGKSTLVNHWLGRMAAEHYRSAELVFGWSFYRQGTSGGSSSADEFLDAALILMQTGLYLTLTRGLGAPEARICYEHAETLCHSLNRPVLLYAGLMSQWVFSLATGKLSATMQIAKRVYSLAQDQNDSALMIGAYSALAATLYFLGDFEAARQNATCGLLIWRTGVVQSPVEEVYAPSVICLIVGALSEWHLGEISSCEALHTSEFCFLAARRRDFARLGAERIR